MEHKVAEINVSYSNTNTERKAVHKSSDAVDVLRASWNPDTIELQEEFKVLMLDRANYTLGVYTLSKGGTTGTVIDIKLLFAVVLKCNASGIIIAHNHPSGNLKSSEADRKITANISKAASLLEIKLLDHVIISKSDFYSFADDGVLI